MKFSARLLFAFVLPMSPAMAAEVTMDPADGWFRPALVEDRSPLCSVALAEANRLFDSKTGELDSRPIVIGDLQAIDPEQDLPREPIVLRNVNTGEPIERTQAVVTTHGKKMYVARRTNPGCGSACETQQMLASLQPFDVPMHYENPPGVSEPTPRAPVLTLLKSPDDLYYVAVIENDQLQVYTLTEDAAWDRICKVHMTPRALNPATHAELQAARKAVWDLHASLDPIRQGAGHTCGTLRAHERGGEKMGEAFSRMLYRPWTLQTSGNKALGASGDALSQWSTLGFDEYAAMAKYRAQLAVTLGALAQFYAHEFDLSQADASLAAEKALGAAMYRGLAFSAGSFFADKSAPVRLAILENKSVADLDALNWQPAPRGDYWNDQDSVLNIAVKHPEALRWLLSKKLDPNQPNAFGKTPLMYAAQHNALEAVRILLEHGANPNAATIFPDDTCTYTLQHANVTALHYAVRYGSAEIVEALLDGGAVTFVKTTKQWDEASGQTPLEWLDSYESPNIAAADRPRLAQLLQSTEGEQLVEYSTQQTLQAEKQYAAGDLDSARRSLKNALQAAPSNERALSDLSLVALRAGQYGESLEAATRLIAASKDPRMLANAWFNVGLACERHGHRYLWYNGELYCRSSAIFPFLQSWRAAKSSARAEKLEQMVATANDKHCAVPQSDGTQHQYLFVHEAEGDDMRGPEIQRVYVLHPAGSDVSAAQVRWTVTPYVGKAPVPRPVTPRLVDSYPLGKSTLTVLESEDKVQKTVHIGDFRCF